MEFATYELLSAVIVLGLCESSVLLICELHVMKGVMMLVASRVSKFV